jgi:hypothetical protein
MMMVRDAIAQAYGNAADHRVIADLLDQASDSIAAIYAARAGGTVAEWRDVLTVSLALADVGHDQQRLAAVSPPRFR